MKASLLALCVSMAIPFCVYQSAHATDVDNHPVKQASSLQQLTEHQKINLNQADAKQLQKAWKGIGKKRAEAIVAYREQHQGFHSIEELVQVKGFSKKFIKANLMSLSQIFSVDKPLEKERT